ncbi:hypothetical protein K435DRAFT_672535 [Dendrothele bispora CBS 962.96]|uniref:DNA mismatch repair protein MSH3 n=1 Tax=Dendrothele bispora (strain CBS 962.96) TaxID=1314807 RepID=A0A4S8LRP7_DENBC|nr:hypothetical protein K435DRAFT_672535 [Dendrothele bispora CBS 962.96]
MSPSKPGQSQISQYFSTQPSSSSSSKKRVIEVIDLTEDPVDEQPSSKRSKKDALSSPGKADQWRFDLQSPVAQVDPAEVDSRKTRHEAFKRKLLLENNTLFINKRHSTVAQDSDPATEGQHSDSESGPDLGKVSSRSSNSRTLRAATTAKIKKTDVGPSGQSYTPLEKQIIKLKEENPGTLLMVEVGYKYKFYGEDAKVAATDLGMVCYSDRNFLTASIPYERRDIHLKNLLSRGHRVGIVNQIETAALKKVGDNRNAVFERKLTHLFTAATFVDALDSIDERESIDLPSFLCIVEDTKSSENEKDVSIGMICICPSTGDVIWDDFADTSMRLELETRVTHMKPSELLSFQDGLTKPSEKILSSAMHSSTSNGKIRRESFLKLMSYTDAFAYLSRYYSSKASNKSVLIVDSGKLMAVISGFPRRVVVALAHTIKHLSDYNLADILSTTEFFSRFTNRCHMVLTANTLSNLEIFQNETDGSTRGTLFSLLNQTKTKFGARLLRRWTGQPLVDKDALQERIDTVKEIIASSSERLVTVNQILRKLPDLARGLCRIQYGQCTPKELATLISAFEKIARSFEPFDEVSDVGFQSRLLNDIIFALPTLRPAIGEIAGAIRTEEALKGNKIDLWTDPDKYPNIEETAMALQAVEVELQDELKLIRKKLKMPSLDWKTWSNEEYLIEVKRDQEKLIPTHWILFNRTAYYARYRSPEVMKKLEERSQLQEMLDAEANIAYRSFLDTIADQHYGLLRNVVDKLAIADCLGSLAQVALQHSPDYVRPSFSAGDELEIIEGRHPIIEDLRSDPFIPNTIRMGTDGEAKTKIITGPNMGGKSSVVRMVALIAIMAQMGSYVPATSAKLGILDSILTRMGASDDLARGRSTFMIEMTETKDILETATSKSLVILDELGRGTSTFDGMAIASAILHHLVQSTACKTLFITHYPYVAKAIEKQFIANVQNLHMGYMTDLRINGTRDITFLYRLTPGIAHESFGIECGRLAGLPEELLLLASQKASEMQKAVDKRIARNR